MSYLICDIDGTLALRGDRAPMAFNECLVDRPSRCVVDMLRILGQSGMGLVLLTGREVQYRPITAAWLLKYGIGYDRLYMRANGEVGQGWIVKQELYEQTILLDRNGEPPSLVIDDDPWVCQMFMELGIVSFQIYQLGIH